MIEIKRVDSSHVDFQYLVTMLDKNLSKKNGDDHDFFDQFNKIDHIHHALVCYIDEEPVGCGAIKPYDKGVMEVKRMYVKPEYRGRGVATAILEELEKWAQALGSSKCILETGEKMPAAIALYEKNGYINIPNYPPYTEVSSSRCFEKKITA